MKLLPRSSKINLLNLKIYPSRRAHIFRVGVTLLIYDQLLVFNCWHSKVHGVLVWSQRN